MRFALVIFALFGCGAQLDDEGLDEEALTGDCATPRAVHCHDSPNNCSYAARRCDPVPRALDRVSKTALFPLKGTGHLVEDSLGNPLGRTIEAAVHLNWGQRRILHGTSKVLAWAAATDQGTVTGWINASAVERDLGWMPSAHGRDPGGSYSTWHIAGSDNRAFLDGTGHSLKVVETCDAGMNATDYLERNGRVNLIFNLPGYSDPALGSGTIDVFPVAARPVFHRAEAQRSIERSLWSCATGHPVMTSRTLKFLYGYVEVSRHGWMAEAVLAPGNG
jgi:hypothetical protein